MSNVWKPGWKQADKCKMFARFSHFTDLCLKNCPFFLISRLRLKNYSLFRESAIPDNIAEAGRLRLPDGTYGSLRQSTAAAHSEVGRRRLCQIKNAHAMAWWREADAGWAVHFSEFSSTTFLYMLYVIVTVSTSITDTMYRPQFDPFPWNEYLSG